MAVIRDRITVYPPEGETVVVDILEDDVSLGTAHAERTTTRMLTLPLSISERTSFYVPRDGTYTVSVKLNDVEIAGPGGTTVTASSFPTEVRASIDTSEMGGVVGSGGSSLLAPDADFIYVTTSDAVMGQANNTAVPFDEPSTTSAGASLTFDGVDTITVVESGLYEIFYEIDWDAGSPVTVAALLATTSQMPAGQVGGRTTLAAAATSGSSFPTSGSTSPLFRLMAGSTVQLKPFISGAATIDVSWAAIAITRVL